MNYRIVGRGKDEADGSGCEASLFHDEDGGSVGSLLVVDFVLYRLPGVLPFVNAKPCGAGSSSDFFQKRLDSSKRKLRHESERILFHFSWWVVDCIALGFNLYRRAKNVVVVVVCRFSVSGDVGKRMSDGIVVDFEKVVEEREIDIGKLKLRILGRTKVDVVRESERFVGSVFDAIKEVEPGVCNSKAKSCSSLSFAHGVVFDVESVVEQAICSVTTQQERIASKISAYVVVRETSNFFGEDGSNQVTICHQFLVLESSPLLVSDAALEDFEFCQFQRPLRAQRLHVGVDLSEKAFELFVLRNKLLLRFDQI